MSSNTLPHSYAMLAGGIAGLSVDVILFPLDTIKTRLQAHGGFRAAGGFSGVYAGLASTASGSIPSAALFFLVYESLRGDTALSHVYASAMAETVSCLIRVPTEVVKQRAQTSRHSVINITRQIWSIHGPVGLYRGFGITLLREIPFTSIQFPLYEALKQYWSITMGTPPSPLEAALCGSAAGIVAAALTTPLDVIKTRWILHKPSEKINSIRAMVRDMIRTEGWSVLTRGILPRMMWIGAGGAVFLGMYEAAKSALLVSSYYTDEVHY